MKRKSKSLSVQEWRELYDAAAEFKKVGCWDCMWDSSIFGVQNPVTGETGYCCVMGRLGEHFALSVYLGAEGWTGILKCVRMIFNSHLICFIYKNT